MKHTCPSACPHVPAANKSIRKKIQFSYINLHSCVRVTNSQYPPAPTTTPSLQIAANRNSKANLYNQQAKWFKMMFKLDQQNQPQDKHIAKISNRWSANHFQKCKDHSQRPGLPAVAHLHLSFGRLDDMEAQECLCV